MFFFIAGNTKKLAGEETRQISRNGNFTTAQIRVFKNYITLFFIPLIPLGKTYSIYLPQTGEYYEHGTFSKMPHDLLAICKEAGRKY